MLDTFQTDVAKKIGVSAIEDKLQIIRIEKSIFKAVAGKFDVECAGLDAPTGSDEYSLYMIGRVDPVTVGLSGLVGTTLWKSGTQLVNESSTKDVFIYTDKGYVVPNHLCHFMKSKSGVVYVAIKNPRSLSYMDLDVIYYRHYQNRWLENNAVTGVFNVSKVNAGTYATEFNNTHNIVKSYTYTQLNSAVKSVSPLNLEGDFDIVIDRTLSQTTEQFYLGDIRIAVHTDDTFSVTRALDIVIAYEPIVNKKITVKREGDVLLFLTNDKLIDHASFNNARINMSRQSSIINTPSSLVVFGDDTAMPWDSSAHASVVVTYIGPLKAKFISKVHENGVFLRSPLGLSDPDASSIIDIHMDKSIRSVKHVPIKNQINFLSVKDSNNKYVIPVDVSGDNPGRVTHYTDLDLYVTYKRGSSSYTGLYLGMHNPKSISMVTNNHIGVSVDHFNVIGDELIKRLAVENIGATLNDLYITIHIKHQSRIINLIPSDNNLYSFSRLDPAFKNAILSGDDGLKEWSAPELENSSYFKAMDVLGTNSMTDLESLKMLGYDGLLALYPNIRRSPTRVNKILDSKLYDAMSCNVIHTDSISTSVSELSQYKSLAAIGGVAQTVPGPVSILSDSRAVAPMQVQNTTWDVSSLTGSISMDVYLNGKALVDSVDYFIADGLLTVVSTAYLGLTMNVLDVVTHDVRTPTNSSDQSVSDLQLETSDYLYLIHSKTPPAQGAINGDVSSYNIIAGNSSVLQGPDGLFLQPVSSIDGSDVFQEVNGRPEYYLNQVLSGVSPVSNIQVAYFPELDQSLGGRLRITGTSVNGDVVDEEFYIAKVNGATPVVFEGSSTYIPAPRIKYYEYGFVSINGLVSHNDIVNVLPGHHRVFGGEMTVDIVEDFANLTPAHKAKVLHKPYMVKRPFLNMDVVLGNGESEKMYDRAVENYFRIEQYLRKKVPTPVVVYDSDITKYNLFSPFMEDVIVRAEAIHLIDQTTIPEINTPTEIDAFCVSSEPLKRRDPVFVLEPKFKRFVNIDPISVQGLPVHKDVVEFAKRVMTHYGISDDIYWIDADFSIIN